MPAFAPVLKLNDAGAVDGDIVGWVVVAETDVEVWELMVGLVVVPVVEGETVVVDLTEMLK